MQGSFSERFALAEERPRIFPCKSTSLLPQSHDIFGGASLEICLSVCRAQAQPHPSAFPFLALCGHCEVPSSCRSVTQMEKKFPFGKLCFVRSGMSQTLLTIPAQI